MTKGTSVLETFNRARYAEWAGDIVYSRRLLESLLKPRQEVIERREGKRRTSVTLIVELIHHAAEELHARLSKVAPTDAAQELIAKALTLKTKHLRGVIRRLSSHEFELRAFLTDYSWESELYERAAQAARTAAQQPLEPDNEEVLPEVEQVSDNSRLFDYLTEDTGREADRGRGSVWIVAEDNFFREVTVGDLALVVVKGVWAQRELPHNVKLLRKGFMEVLLQIDEMAELHNRDEMEIF